MLQIEQTHSMDEYLELLSDSLKIYMDEERLHRAYEDACWVTEDYKALTTLLLKIESGGKFISLSPDNLVKFLLSIGVDLDKRFASKKTKGYSLDMKRVITPLIEAGVAVELLTAYKTYSSYRSYSNFLRTLVEASPERKVTSTGRVLSVFPTHIEEKENLRAYYSDIAVVSVPKMFSNMITGSDDQHMLAWCDYPQADWRFAYNLFIRDAENAKVMQQCTDAYEGLARMTQGSNFNLETFKEQRKEFKVNCLKVFYNSKDSAPIPSAIRAFFRGSPKYRRFLYDASLFYKFHLPIPCTSYFGFEQLLPEKAYPDAFISKALNTPIQTFTSHIVNETVFGVLNRFWDLGYTKNDINVYFVRHDEPLFMFTPKIIKDSWVFKDCSEVYIPGFTPIHLNFHFGHYYQEEDEMVTQEINAAIEKSDHVYTVPDGTGEIKDYWPLPSVESCYMQFFVRGDSDLRVELYDYRTSRRRTQIVEGETNPQNAIVRCLNEGALDWLHRPQYLLVSTAGIDMMEYAGPDDCTLVKVIDKADVAVMLRE